MTVGAMSEISEVVEKVWHPVTYLTFPLSGAMFMVGWLPEEARRRNLALQHAARFKGGIE